MPMPPKELLALYKDTRNRFNVLGVQMTLEIEKESRELAYLYQVHGARTSAILTASNPRARVLTREENHLRNRALEDGLSRRGLKVLRGEIAGDRERSAQECFLVLGIEITTAIQRAWQYGQIAFIYAGPEAIPELVPAIWRQR